MVTTRFSYYFRSVQTVLFALVLLTILSGVAYAQDETPEPTITLENIDQLTLLTRIENENPDVIRSMIWSPDSQQFVVVSIEKTLLYTLNELESPLLLESYDRKYGDGLSLDGGAAFNQDGSLLATTNGSTVRVWDAETLEPVAEWSNSLPPDQLVFSPDGTILAVSSRTPELDDPFVVSLWNVESEQLVGVVGYPYSGRWFASLFAFNADGSRLFTTYRHIHSWDYRNPAGYRDPNLLSKAEAIDYLMTAGWYVSPDAPLYQWTIFRNTDGLYALWLIAEDGAAFFAPQKGALQPITPHESGEAPYDDQGIPQSIDGYERLDSSASIKVFSDFIQLGYSTSDVPIRITGRSEAAPAVPQYRYDETQDTFTDLSTGDVYRAVEAKGVGQFLNADGVVMERLPFGYYHLGESRLPETLGTTASEIQGLKAEGRLIVLREAGETYILVDVESGETLFTFTDTLTEPFEVVSFNHDKTLVALSPIEGLGFSLWGMQSGVRVLHFEAQNHAVFSPDGRWLAVRGPGSFVIEFWGIPPSGGEG